ncbi:MAG: response regulator transcription factor [Deltaproteobacteria bacterium]|nr:response regulator transcription factor [Deltaproteobacteria bacterium]
MAESMILVADARQEQRDQLAAALVRAGLTERIVSSESGRRLITDYVRALQRGEAVRAIVLDLNLSVLGGKTCSIAVRCIEQAFEQPPVPILFLSAKELDANLKRVMTYVKSSGFLQHQSADASVVVEALRGILS